MTYPLSAEIVPLSFWFASNQSADVVQIRAAIFALREPLWQESSAANE